MKIRIISLLVLLNVFVFSHAVLAQETAQPRQVVIHLTQFSSDLHAVNMALKFGTMAANAGANVTLFLDLDGVRLADARQPLNLTWGHGDSVATLFDAYVKSGGRILVCPHCAHAVGLEADNLRQGATMSDEKALLSILMEADVILDY
jgi:predicted peroxiredoxin